MCDDYDPFDDWCSIGILFTISVLHTLAILLLNSTVILNETFVELCVYVVWIMFFKTSREPFGDLWLYYRFK